MRSHPYLVFLLPLERKIGCEYWNTSFVLVLESCRIINVRETNFRVCFPNIAASLSVITGLTQLKPHAVIVSPQPNIFGCLSFSTVDVSVSGKMFCTSAVPPMEASQGRASSSLVAPIEAALAKLSFS